MNETGSAIKYIGILVLLCILTFVSSYLILSLSLSSLSHVAVNFSKVIHSICLRLSLEFCLKCVPRNVWFPVTQAVRGRSGHSAFDVCSLTRTGSTWCEIPEVNLPLANNAMQTICIYNSRIISKFTTQNQTKLKKKTLKMSKSLRKLCGSQQCCWLINRSKSTDV